MEKEGRIEGKRGKERRNMREWERISKAKSSKKVFYQKMWERFIGSKASSGELGDKGRRIKRRANEKRGETKTYTSCSNEVEYRDFGKKIGLTPIVSDGCCWWGEC